MTDLMTKDEIEAIGHEAEMHQLDSKLPLSVPTKVILRLCNTALSAVNLKEENKQLEAFKAVAIVLERHIATLKKENDELIAMLETVRELRRFNAAEIKKT